MNQLVEFPYLPSGDPQRAVLSLIMACREMPATGEQFRNFRKRMKEYRLWDQKRIAGTLAFLNMEHAGQMKRSKLVRDLAAQKTDGKAHELLATRLWEANPLLFKTIIELLKERVHSRDDIVKHVDSFAYRGKKPSRPELESWLHMALGLDILKMVGIAFDLGQRGKSYLDMAAQFDVEEFLDDVAAAENDTVTEELDTISPSDTAPTADGISAEAGEAAGAGPADSDEVAPTAGRDTDAKAGDTGGQPGSASNAKAGPIAAAGAAARSVTVPAGARSADGSLLAIDTSSLDTPRGRGQPTTVSRFVGQDVFPDDVLDETAQRIDSWWAEQSPQAVGAKPTDFGFNAETWMENADEALYRIAVASALVFRLGRDRESVRAIYGALDQAGVLGDLYYGTAPDVLPEHVDSKALMLASLIARRCAEAPDLAATLEKQNSAGEAFTVLDNALGRGLLKIELFWMMGAVAEIGALRHQDLRHFTALPRRLVRDTLFRLGFVASPYAHDGSSLAPSARAARRAVGTTASSPDEILISFALAAGCAYDCPNRRHCEYACRERAE